MQAFDRLLDAFTGTRGCCLLFHRVTAGRDWSDLPDREFYVTVESLDALLGGLRRGGWDIVTLDEALRRRSGARRFVNFSIDDAYRDTWELAAPLFRAHGVPLTVFVTTGVPDGGDALWNRGLETVLQDSRAVALRGQVAILELPDAAARRAAFRHLRTLWEATDPVARYHEFCADNGRDPVDLHARHAITWDMLRSLADDPGIEIGAHTMSHPRLSALPDHVALAEMRGSRLRLEQQLGVPVRHFAYPYGRRGDCGPRESSLARQAGFASAATTRKGVIRPGRPVDPFRLPRNTLNGARTGTASLQAHLTGLSGALARALRRD